MSINIKAIIVLTPMALILWFVAFHVFSDRYTYFESSLLGLYFTTVGSMAGCLIAEVNQRLADEKHEELMSRVNKSTVLLKCTSRSRSGTATLNNRNSTPQYCTLSN